MTIDLLMRLVHGLMLALFAGWGAYFIWVLFRFRRGRQPRAIYDGAKGRWASMTEVGVVIAEGVLLVASARPIWYERTAARPADPAVVIRVVAEQFVWNVHYPGADGQFGRTALNLISVTNPIGLDRASAGGKDDLVLLGEIHVPVGKPVVIQLSSKDVIHSFGVHALRVKQDVIPGTMSAVWFTAAAPGEFEIACSQLCGVGHYRMRGLIVAESDEAYRAFLQKEAAALK